MIKNSKDYLQLDILPSLGDLANVKLPDPTLLDFYKRLENREILINQDIDDGIVEWTQEIIEWNRIDKDKNIEDRKPIRIYINSNGGSLNAIMELITICNLSKTPVYAIGMGKCYSSGGLLLMGLPKGNRYILSTTEALIHDGSTGSVGDTGKVLDDLEYTKKVEEKTKQFILSHTTITEDEYDKNYRRNWWLDSGEIIAKGVADHIIEDISELF
jgi:ATP-dependent Clp protease protease subunit